MSQIAISKIYECVVGVISWKIKNPRFRAIFRYFHKKKYKILLTSGGRKNREVDFDFLRRKACALRHRRAAGADELR